MLLRVCCMFLEILYSLHFPLSLVKLLGTLIRFLFRLTKQLRIENKIVTMERASNKMKNKKIPQYQNIYKRQQKIPQYQNIYKRQQKNVERKKIVTTNTQIHHHVLTFWDWYRHFNKQLPTHMFNSNVDFIKAQISNLMCTRRFWNNLYAQNQKIGKPNNLKKIGSNKSFDLGTQIHGRYDYLKIQIFCA